MPEFSFEFDKDARQIVMRGPNGYETRFVTEMPIYRGGFGDRSAYGRGDFVSHDGSVWRCTTPTSEAPGAVDVAAWTKVCG